MLRGTNADAATDDDDDDDIGVRVRTEGAAAPLRGCQTTYLLKYLL